MKTTWNPKQTEIAMVISPKLPELLCRDLSLPLALGPQGLSR